DPTAAFYELDAPIARVAAADVPTPYNGDLEAASIPNAEAVTLAVRRIVGTREE
ncbi:MAG: alpha-ketoacid dehydrogenase subunit beta, partial [Gammaproteobacteria bacterium]|nr:alpha-ketoacid dehydrogenase subunit beta [Gammaproteobacteria bacterium]